MPDKHVHTNDCTPMNCETMTSLEWIQMHEKGPAGGWITTSTGKQFSFIDPQPDQICIEDIAHHLSNICHWNGACREFFSVAQHSVLVSMIVPRTLGRWGLLHDAAEAYCGDMTRPLKALLPEYKTIEKRILQVIAGKFSLEWPEPSELKPYDDRILRLESQIYMHPSEILHDGHGNPVEIPDLTANERSAIRGMITACEPWKAKTMFMMRFRELFPEFAG